MSIDALVARHRADQHEREEDGLLPACVTASAMPGAASILSHGTTPTATARDRGEQHCADDQRNDDRARHVALRVARLLARDGDGVEADVREEDERRAVDDPAETERRERMVRARVDRARERRPTKATIATSWTTTSTQVRRRRLADADRDRIADNTIANREHIDLRVREVEAVQRRRCSRSAPTRAA